MKLTLLRSAGLAAGLALVATAAAQESKPLGLAVRAGIFWPSDGQARKAGKTWFASGLEYTLKQQALPKYEEGKTSLSLSADYYSKGSYRAVPLLVNVVAHNDEFYYSLGAGLSFNREPVTGGTSTKSRFAYAVSAGYNFQRGKSPLFVEGRYYGNSKAALSGFAVMAGIRL